MNGRAYTKIMHLAVRLSRDAEIVAAEAGASVPNDAALNEALDTLSDRMQDLIAVVTKAPPCSVPRLSLFPPL